MCQLAPRTRPPRTFLFIDSRMCHPTSFPPNLTITQLSLACTFAFIVPCTEDFHLIGSRRPNLLRRSGHLTVRPDDEEKMEDMDWSSVDFALFNYGSTRSASSPCANKIPGGGEVCPSRQNGRTKRTSILSSWNRAKRKSPSSRRTKDRNGMGRTNSPRSIARKFVRSHRSEMGERRPPHCILFCSQNILYQHTPHAGFIRMPNNSRLRTSRSG